MGLLLLGAVLEQHSLVNRLENFVKLICDLENIPVMIIRRYNKAWQVAIF